MKLSVIIVTLVSVTALGARDAMALPQFKKAFEEKYIKSGDHPELKDPVKKAACNTCHIKGEAKTEQNSYGRALNELIEGSAKERLDAAKEISRDEQKVELAKLVAEFEAALVKVEALDSESGETYGERIKAGKLPVDVPADDDDDDDDEAGES